MSVADLGTMDVSTLTESIRKSSPPTKQPFRHLSLSLLISRVGDHNGKAIKAVTVYRELKDKNLTVGSRGERLTVSTWTGHCWVRGPPWWPHWERSKRPAGHTEEGWELSQAWPLPDGWAWGPAPGRCLLRQRRRWDVCEGTCRKAPGHLSPPRARHSPSTGRRHPGSLR